MKNELPLIPTNITNNVDYSPGSIISKIIFKNNNLQITLFAVSNGESFEKHTTSKEAIVHILDGEGEFYLNESWQAFKNGDYFYMPASLVHAIQAKTNFKFLLYQF